MSRSYCTRYSILLFRLQEVFEKGRHHRQQQQQQQQHPAGKSSSLDEPDTKNVRRPPQILPASRTTAIGHLLLRPAAPATPVKVAPSSLVSSRRPLTFNGAPAADAFQREKKTVQQQQKQQQQHCSASSGVDRRSLFYQPLFPQQQQQHHRAANNNNNNNAGVHVRCELVDDVELELGRGHGKHGFNGNNNNLSAAAAAPMKTSTPNDAHHRTRTRTRFAFPSAAAFGRSVIAESSVIDGDDGGGANNSNVNNPLPSGINESFNSVVTNSQDTSQR